MKKFLVAALLAALSLAGINNKVEAQSKKVIKGKVMPVTTTTRVITREVEPTYQVVEHRYYQPFTGYRRIIRDDDLLTNDVLIRDGVEFRRTWVPGYFNGNDEWVSGHYEWTHTEE